MTATHMRRIAAAEGALAGATENAGGGVISEVEMRLDTDVVTSNSQSSLAPLARAYSSPKRQVATSTTSPAFRDCTFGAMGNPVGVGHGTFAVHTESTIPRCSGAEVQPPSKPRCSYTHTHQGQAWPGSGAVQAGQGRPRSE